MIIHDFNVFGLVVRPFETDTPLIVDTNAILPGTIALQFLKVIARRGKQILQIFGIIQVEQLAAGGALNIFRQLCGSIAKAQLCATNFSTKATTASSPSR
jgi:hypothetical protein